MDIYSQYSLAIFGMFCIFWHMCWYDIKDLWKKGRTLECFENDAPVFVLAALFILGYYVNNRDTFWDTAWSLRIFITAGACYLITVFLLWERPVILNATFSSEFDDDGVEVKYGACAIFIDGEEHKVVHGYSAFEKEMDDLIKVKGIDPDRIDTFNLHGC